MLSYYGTQWNMRSLPGRTVEESKRFVRYRNTKISMIGSMCTLWLMLAVVLVFIPLSLAFTKHLPRVNYFYKAKDVFSATTNPNLTPEPPALQVEDLTCTHDGGDNYQLYEVSYNLPRGAKVALLGRNGAGKSTFLRILAEATCLDARLSTADMGMKFTGKITCPRNVRVAFVEQEPPMLADVTVADALLGMSGDDMGTEWITNRNDKSVYATVRRYRHASENVDSDREYCFCQFCLEISTCSKVILSI